MNTPTQEEKQYKIAHALGHDFADRCNWTPLVFCHQAENALTVDQHFKFREILRSLAVAQISPTSHGPERAYVSASPELRAEALFRVIVREAVAAGNAPSEASQPNVAQPEP